MEEYTSEDDIVLLSIIKISTNEDSDGKRLGSCCSKIEELRNSINEEELFQRTMIVFIDIKSNVFLTMLGIETLKS